MSEFLEELLSGFDEEEAPAPAPELADAVETPVTPIEGGEPTADASLGAAHGELAARTKELDDRDSALDQRQLELDKVEEELKQIAASLESSNASQDVIDLQSKILGAVFQKDTQLVLEIVKELDISTDEIRRLV